MAGVYGRISDLFLLVLAQTQEDGILHLQRQAMNINVTITDDPRLARIEEMMDQVLSTLENLLQRSTDMSASLDRLTQEVSQTRGVVESAVTLLAGLAAQIRDSIGDDEALEALADDLDNQQAALAQAISEFPTTPPGGTDEGSGGAVTEPGPTEPPTGDGSL